jgi:hypothetical protein
VKVRISVEPIFPDGSESQPVGGSYLGLGSGEVDGKLESYGLGLGFCFLEAVWSPCPMVIERVRNACQPR